MEKQRIMAETVRKKISHCSGTCQGCVCNKLAEYMDEVGIDEFVQRLAAGQVPNDIEKIYHQKVATLK